MLIDFYAIILERETDDLVLTTASTVIYLHKCNDVLRQKKNIYYCNLLHENNVSNILRLQTLTDSNSSDSCLYELNSSIDKNIEKHAYTEHCHFNV